MLNNREILGSELKDKIELYSELTGENGWNVPVARVADFISGFEMGKERFRKRGHWIGINDIESECSECGHREPNERFIFEDINFCAKCGAKMESEVEDAT